MAALLAHDVLMYRWMPGFREAGCQEDRGNANHRSDRWWRARPLQTGCRPEVAALTGNRSKSEGVGAFWGVGHLVFMARPDAPAVAKILRELGPRLILEAGN